MVKTIVIGKEKCWGEMTVEDMGELWDGSNGKFLVLELFVMAGSEQVQCAKVGVIAII